MIGGQLHNERSRVACEHLRLLQHDAGDNDGGSAEEVGARSDPPCTVEQSRGDHGDDRELCAAGDERRRHDGHLAVSVIFNGTGGHDARNAAAGADEHRDEGLAGQAELAEDTVHHECDTGHVAAGFEEGQEDEQDEHLRDEAKDCADAADDAVKDQAVEPIRAVDGVQAVFHKDRDAGDPHAVVARIRSGLHGGVIDLGDVIARSGEGVAVAAVGFVKCAEVLVVDGVQNVLRADNAFVSGLGDLCDDLRCPDVLFGVLVDGIVIGARADTEQMPAVAEQAVVRPVGRPGADRRNGDIVNKAHDQGKDRQSQPAVRDHAVDLIGGGELAGVLLLVAALHQGGDIDIALVRDDALGIVVQLLLGSLDVLLNVRLHIGGELELRHGLLVALEDLDGVPALLLLRHLMHSDLFDVGQRMLDRTGERVHRNGLRALGGLDGSLGGFHDTGTLQGRDLDDLAAKLTGQLCGVDLIAVLADNVHHVDGDDDRDAQFGELRGEVQVALEVRAVDDVQDRIGTLADQVVTGDDLLQRVRGQGVDTRKVGDRHTVVLLELAFLLFHGDAGPVANELVRTGQRVEQRRLAAVRVARKGNSNVHFASSLSGFQ